MVTLISARDLTLNLDEVKQVIAKHYPTADDMKKIKLKCWLYYAESRAEGGKEAVTFNQYTKSVSGFMHYREMIKGYMIDTSDLGGNIRALQTLSEWYFKD